MKTANLKNRSILSMFPVTVRDYLKQSNAYCPSVLRLRASEIRDYAIKVRAVRTASMIDDSEPLTPATIEPLIEIMAELTCDRHNLPACSACTRDFPEHYQKLVLDACQQRNLIAELS